MILFKIITIHNNLRALIGRQLKLQSVVWEAGRLGKRSNKNQVTVRPVGVNPV